MNDKTLQYRLEEIQTILSPNSFPIPKLKDVEYEMEDLNTIQIIFPTWDSQYISSTNCKELYNAGYHIFSIKNRNDQAGFPTGKMAFVLEIYMKKYKENKKEKPKRMVKAGDCWV